MRKNSLCALVVTLVLLPCQPFAADNTLSTVNDHKWWGVEMEGAPSIGSRLQGTTLQLNIDDIAGLEGEVRSPTVMITCPPALESFLVTQQFLKIFADKLSINGEECECLPLRLKECILSNLLFSLNASDIKPVPLPAFQTIKIKSTLIGDLLSPFQSIVEIIDQNLLENKMKDFSFFEGGILKFNWKLSKPFIIEIDNPNMISKKATSYTISSVASAEYYFELYARIGGPSLRRAFTLEAFREMFEKIKKSYNVLKMNPGSCKEIFELKLYIDPKNKTSCLIFINSSEEDGIEKTRLILNIEP